MLSLCQTAGQHLKPLKQLNISGFCSALLSLLKTLIMTYYVFVYVCGLVCLGMCIHVTAHMWRLEGSLAVTGHFVHQYVGSGDPTHILRLV